MFESTGSLVYDPRTERLKYEPGWIIVRTCPELLRYYRIQAQKENHVKLQAPAWGSHISVLRGEESLPDCQKYPDKTIVFNYTGDIITNELYYWIHISSKDLNNLREEMGLSPFPKYPFHITLGKVIYSTTKIKDLNT